MTRQKSCMPFVGTIAGSLEDFFASTGVEASANLRPSVATIFSSLSFTSVRIPCIA